MTISLFETPNTNNQGVWLRDRMGRWCAVSVFASDFKPGWLIWFPHQLWQKRPIFSVHIRRRRSISTKRSGSPKLFLLRLQ